jgi:Tfp pilus assembly protein PilN
MRPVNLLPLEERRGLNAPNRTGRFAPYLIVGLLFAALVGVTALVLTNNEISDRKAEIAELKDEASKLQVRADRLAAYSQFRDVREQRAATVANLADSRFDWERVLRELALIIPGDVWLVNVTGSAASGIDAADGAAIATRDAVAGPALEIVGCAPGQEAVARFVAALYDIGGVTRVGVATSMLPDPGTQSTAVVSDTDSDDCRTRDFIARFEIVVAFDAASAATVAPSAPPIGTAPVAAGSTSPTATASGGQG